MEKLFYEHSKRLECPQENECNKLIKDKPRNMDALRFSKANVDFWWIFSLIRKWLYE